MQVNLDFQDEADMVQMARLGIALQPIATALFANSPFRDGKPTGYLSWRSHVWTDTVRGCPPPPRASPQFKVCAGVLSAISKVSVAVSSVGRRRGCGYAALMWIFGTCSLELAP